LLELRANVIQGHERVGSFEIFFILKRSRHGQLVFAYETEEKQCDSSPAGSWGEGGASYIGRLGRARRGVGR
jgi:hypothetical protein